METLAKRLPKLRKRKGVTQCELAEILEVTERTVQNYEAGQIMPRARTLEAMARYFGVSINYLIGIEDETLGKRYQGFAFLEGLELSDLTFDELKLLYDLAKKKKASRAKNDGDNA